MATDKALRRRIVRIVATLRGIFGRPDLRVRGDPLDVLIRTILSQSTNDLNSGRAYAALRNRFPTWDVALGAGPDEIERTIHSGGLARQKSVRIHRVLERVKREQGMLSLSDLRSWTDEQAFAWLGRFEGVGTKTIAIVLMFACGRDICPVDTHVHRIARRLGLVRDTANADETFRTLQRNLPKGEGPALHANLLMFGRTRCTARDPGCGTCPFRARCRYDRKNDTIRLRRAQTGR